MLLERSRPSPQAQQTQPYAKSIVHFLCRAFGNPDLPADAYEKIGSSIPRI